MVACVPWRRLPFWAWHSAARSPTVDLQGLIGRAAFFRRAYTVLPARKRACHVLVTRGGLPRSRGEGVHAVQRQRRSAISADAAASG